MENKYKQVGKMSFTIETPGALCKAFNGLLGTDTVVKIYYGNMVTGECWNEENDIIGTIGRSSGTLKVPLLISPGEHGGTAISSVVAIREMLTGRFIYVNPRFSLPVVDIRNSTQAGYKYSTYVNGEIHGNHRELIDACNTAALLH